MTTEPRVAFVYDRIVKFGGAERVLLALHEIWPDAPIYTAVYDSKGAQWAKTIRIEPSFLQHIPLAVQHHEWFAWLTPMAFESFSFDEYDIVISITSAEAKNIITKPKTLHICYCLTPTRYLWSGAETYAARPTIGMPSWISRIGLRASIGRLQAWDRIASKRPDAYIAISQLVAARIKQFYGQEVHSVVYPPVNVSAFSKAQKNTGTYYLLVARLVSYKRVDIVVEAFNRLGWPLVIIGEGVEKKRLMRQAHKNIRFVGLVTEAELVTYYANCYAFVFAGSEDFGIAAVEAQASGKPVIAYANSGIAEIIEPGVTGMLFRTQSSEALVDSLKLFRNQWYDNASCVARAQKFSSDRFKREMKETVQTVYNRYI